MRRRRNQWCSTHRKRCATADLAAATAAHKPSSRTSIYRLRPTPASTLHLLFNLSLTYLPTCRKEMGIRPIDLTAAVPLVATAGWLALKGDSALQLVLAAVAGAAAFVLLYSGSAPARWVSKLHEKFSEQPGTALRNARKVGTKVPPPYPDAWYGVAYSAEVPCGAVRDVTVANINMVVWRPNRKPGDKVDPPAVVQNAYCPHLGAHLAIGGGRVEGQCLRCPFHGWAFDPKGKLTSVPGIEDGSPLPPNSDIETWPTVERNGVIHVWVSSAVFRKENTTTEASTAASSTSTAAKSSSEEAGGVAVHEKKAAPACGSECASTAGHAAPQSRNAPRQRGNVPTYEVPFFPRLNDGSLEYLGYAENIVLCHMLEIPENGGDVAHLPVLHGDFVIPQLSWALGHRWTASFTPGGTTDPARKHLADIKITEAITLFDKELPGKVYVSITQAGPSQVYLDMMTPVGPIFLVQLVVPVSPLKQRVTHAAFAPKWMPAAFAKAVLWAAIVQVERDIPTWSAKVYMPKPLLSREDKAIVTYRRWIQQFFTPASLSFEDAVRQHAMDAMGLPEDAKLDW